MNMKITCTNCGKAFEASAKQQKLIDAIKAKGGKLVMVECPHCYFDFGAVLDKVDEPEDEPYRCPVSGCTGWVSFVEMKGRAPFHGCGECGSTWSAKANLFRDITAAIARYPYRKKAYRKDGAGWLPGDPDEEPANYESKVEREPKEFGPTFEKD